MPVICRILFLIHRLNETEGLSLGLSKIASVYRLQSFGYSRMALKEKIGSPYLVFKSFAIDYDWKRRYFFIKASSLCRGLLSED